MAQPRPVRRRTAKETARRLGQAEVPDGQPLVISPDGLNRRLSDDEVTALTRDAMKWRDQIEEVGRIATALKLMYADESLARRVAEGDRDQLRQLAQQYSQQLENQRQLKVLEEEVRARAANGQTLDDQTDGPLDERSLPIHQPEPPSPPS